MDREKRQREESPEVDGPPSHLSFFPAKSSASDFVLFLDLVVLVLIVCVFKIISPMAASEIGGPSDAARPRSVSPLEPASPHSPSFSTGQGGIWNFMLERDEACRFHSDSIHEVAQLKAHLDYL